MKTFITICSIRVPKNSKDLIKDILINKFDFNISFIELELGYNTIRLIVAIESESLTDINVQNLKSNVRLIDVTSFCLEIQKKI